VGFDQIDMQDTEYYLGGMIKVWIDNGAS
jgi:hypothetical protein